MTLHGARPRTYSHYKHIAIQGGPLRGLRDRALVSSTKAILGILRDRALVSPAQLSIRWLRGMRSEGGLIVRGGK